MYLMQLFHTHLRVSFGFWTDDTMPCQQLRLPLLKRLADFQMSAVAKALVTSSNWKVGRWEVKTFQEMGVFNPSGYPKIINFSWDFPYTNHFGDLPNGNLEKGRKNLSGNKTQCGEPFRYS